MLAVAKLLVLYALTVLVLFLNYIGGYVSGFSNGGVFTFVAKKNLVLTLVARY